MLNSGSDRMFFRELIKDFYDRIINTDSFDDFEVSSIEWIMNTLERNDMNAKIFFELNQNHRIGFSSLIGFFHQHGIGCDANRDKALEMYLLAIKHDKDQIINNIIAKYLLSLFYYKDIILVKKLSIDSTIEGSEKEGVQQGESNHSENRNPKNQRETIKLDEDGSDYACPSEVKVEPNERTSFVRHAISAREGDIAAQYHLGHYYEFGIGTNKDEVKAFEWYLKSAEAGNHCAQYSVGHCYEFGIGTNKDEREAFTWYLESAEAGNHRAQYSIGLCHQHGKGTNKDGKKAFEWYLQSAEAGNDAAQYILSCFYELAIGTRMKRKHSNAGLVWL